MRVPRGCIKSPSPAEFLQYRSDHVAANHSTLSIVLAGILLYFAISSYASRRRFEAFARAHGCERPYNANSKWPWKLDRMHAVLTARSRGIDPMDDIFSAPLYANPSLERTGLFGTKLIETIEPENVKAMLATNFRDWPIGEDRHSSFRPVLGHSIFTSDGVFWEHSRAMFRPQFARDLINDLESTERSIGTLFEAIGSVDAEGWTKQVDLLPLIFCLVLDNASEFLFGKSVESLKTHMRSSSNEAIGEGKDLGHLAGGQEYAEAFDLCSYYMAVATVRSVPERYVRQALSGQRHEVKQRKFDLLSSLVAQTQDSKELEDQAMAIMFAGRDTTSTLLVWTILLLGQHPDVFDKLRSTVLQRFDPHMSDILDFAQLKDCRYLQHCIQETLRLYSVVPLNSRVAAKDTVLPVGGGRDGKSPMAVRKGQQVLWNIYAMHRRKDLWGEDALEYKPERWDDSKLRTQGGSYLFTPFSAGPRICLGQQYALTEAAYCLVRLLQRYDRIELAPDSAAAKHEHIKKSISITLAPTELRLRLHEAEQGRN